MLSIIQGVLFVNVGYSAHCMRPHTGNFLDSLAAPSPSSGGKEGEEGGKAKAKGWCVASFDWAGSGYSQGVRCLYNGPDLGRPPAVRGAGKEDEGAPLVRFQKMSRGLINTGEWTGRLFWCLDVFKRS